MTKDVLHKIKAAMFDLDGTLFDSIGIWTKIDEMFLAARGRVPTPEYKHSIAAMSNAECAKFTIEYYNLDDTPEALIAEWHDMARREYSSVELMPHAKEYLQSVHSRGIKIYALSSLDKELAILALKHSGIYELFSGLIFAGQGGLSKNKPEIYLHAAKTAEAAPSACVMFDDIIRATCAAKEAGFISVAVRNEKSYDDGLTADSDSADYFVSSFAAAPELYFD